MRRPLQLIIAAGALLSAFAAAGPADAQKRGGILKSYSIDSPASMSIHEEATVFALRPAMAVFNNLVLYDQHVKQNSMQSIVPELAKSWAWDEDGTRLTFKLHEGVKWHDGKPFTAADVKCTWDLLQGKASEKLRINPRKAWYRNLDEVTTNGDYEATFVLKRPQPAFLALLASGFSPVYPCHVSPRDMRQHPIGTGPFKFVEFKPNESIKLVRNPDYWKPDRPYLDGIEYTIIKNMSTAMLTFVSGKLDVTFGGLTVPLTRDITNQSPQAICELNADKCQPQPDHQPRCGTLRQPGFAPGDGAEPRPQGLHRHHHRRKGQYRRGHVAAARWGMGHAGRGLALSARLRPRRGQEPQGSAGHHATARLWPRQAARRQGVDARHPALSRSVGGPDRPAEGGLYRRRARDGRHDPVVSRRSTARTTRWRST